VAPTELRFGGRADEERLAVVDKIPGDRLRAHLEGPGAVPFTGPQLAAESVQMRLRPLRRPPRDDDSVTAWPLLLSSCSTNASTNASAAANSGCLSLSSLRTYSLFSRACADTTTAITPFPLTAISFLLSRPWP